MLRTKFWIIWHSGFSGEDAQKSTNQKQELPVAAMFVNASGRNEQYLQTTAHRCFLHVPSFGSFGKRVSEQKNLKNQPIRNKSRLWRSCLLTDRDEMSNTNRGPFIDASYQVSVHLAKRFQRRRLLEIGQSQTRIACGGHVCKQVGTKRAILLENLLQIFPIKSWFTWQSGFRVEDYQKSANH